MSIKRQLKKVMGIMLTYTTRNVYSILLEIKKIL